MFTTDLVNLYDRNIFKTSLYIYIFQDEKCRLMRNLSLSMDIIEVSQEGFHIGILGSISEMYPSKYISRRFLRKNIRQVSQERYQRGLKGRISERSHRKDIREVSQEGFQRGVIGRISERCHRKDVREVSYIGRISERYLKKDIRNVS